MQCVSCGKDGTKLCAQCGVARYCSRECQKAHWLNHKTQCKSLKVEKQSKSAEKKNAEQEQAVDYFHSGEDFWAKGTLSVEQGKLEAAAEDFVYAFWLDNALTGRGNEEGPRKVVTGLLLAEEDRTGSFDKQLARIRAQTATLPDKNPYAALIYLTMYLTEGLLGISLLDQLIERNPSNPYLYINRGRRLGQIGEHRFLQGDRAGSVRDFRNQMLDVERAAALMGTNSVTMMFELAYTYRDNAQVEKSIKWYQVALKAAPSDHWFRPQAEESLALMQYSKGRNLFGRE